MGADTDATVSVRGDEVVIYRAMYPEFEGKSYKLEHLFRLKLTGTKLAGQLFVRDNPKDQFAPLRSIEGVFVSEGELQLDGTPFRLVEAGEVGSSTPLGPNGPNLIPSGAPSPVTPSGVEGRTPSVARLTDEPGPSKVMPKDLEMIFLQRAEDSIEKGTCDRFLLGLEDIALDAERNARSEQARVLRARCFDTQMRPRQAMNEYRKYLEAYPRGRFSAEAHQALGE